MCGIVGYIGREQAAPILLNGLGRLEYRGYDSAGICVAADGVLRSERPASWHFSPPPRQKRQLRQPRRPKKRQTMWKKRSG